MIKRSTTLMKGRLGLTHRRPNYQPTGTRLSPRFILVWRSAIRPSSLSSTSRPTLWAVTDGRLWLFLRLLCSLTVTKKTSMLWLIVTVPNREPVSLVTKKMFALGLIPESGLVQEDILMTSTLVGMQLPSIQIMETLKNIKAMGYILVQWQRKQGSFREQRCLWNK